MLGSEQSIYAHQIASAEAVAILNDGLRKHGKGGLIVITRGVRALPKYDPAKLMRVLASFESFDPDNDPHGERDFGDVELCGQTLLWKIDYYDNELEQASSDAADPLVTTRVLTVMLEHEY